MTAIAAKPASGASLNPVASGIGIVVLIILIGIMYAIGGQIALIALIGIIVGGLLIAFGVHFVPVGGAPAAMGQAPGIATGVAMLAAGAGLAGLFGGAWAWAVQTNPDLLVAVITGGVGGGLMMAITCFFVNFIYIFGMGIPAASGKVKVDPLTGDTQPEFKSQGTEGHGLPFISFVGGVIGGIFGGAGGTLIYLMLLNVYQEVLPKMTVFDKAGAAGVLPIAISLAGIFAVGMFLINAVLAAYNITGTIEGPHDPKFKRFPRALIASAIASGLCGVAALAIVFVPV